MKSFFRFMFFLLVLGVFATAVASFFSKKKLEVMTDDEIREYLQEKLSDKLGDEQIVKIQDAAVKKVRGKKPSVEHYAQDAETPFDEPADVEEDTT